MNEKQAREIIHDYQRYGEFGPSDSDFRKACLYLVDEKQDMDAAVELGKHYYMLNKNRLALKYLNLALEHDNAAANACLGFLWYTGAPGERDYEKAYEYFAESMRLMTGRNINNESFWKDDIRVSLKSQKEYDDYIQCAFVLATMYRNGNGVEQSFEKFAYLCRQLHWILTESNYFRPVKSYLPMVDFDLADIALHDQKNPDSEKEALKYLREAKSETHREIINRPSESAFDFMKSIVFNIWDIQPVTPENMDLYDLYVVMQEPCTVRFLYGRTKVLLKAKRTDEGDVVVCRGNDVYLSVDLWIESGRLGNDPVPLANSKCKNFTIEK